MYLRAYMSTWLRPYILRAYVPSGIRKKNLSILFYGWEGQITLQSRNDSLRQTLADIDLRYEYIIRSLNLFLKYIHPF